MESVLLDDAKLQQWTEQLSEQWFHRPFLHRIRFNKRLRSCGGRYFPRTGDIDISWYHYLAYGVTEAEGIIKHELCHYHLHQQGLPSAHRDKSFKDLLASVGAPRFCRVLPKSKSKSKRISDSKWNRKSTFRNDPKGLISKLASLFRTAEPYRYRLVCNGCARFVLRKRKTKPERFRCGKCHGSLRLEPISE